MSLFTTPKRPMKNAVVAPTINTIESAVSDSSNSGDILATMNMPAVTMVAAGIFMVARMSPLFELSETALSMVLIVGATTAFFMGLLGVVNNDIKRVIAYSTLSQLGYMTVALGASAYGAGIFHLMTHAFFKALLFLAAGSVIMAMHHEQDMRQMGGLKRHLPITYWTFPVSYTHLRAH